jgi:Fe-S-cluster containining protein
MCGACCDPIRLEVTKKTVRENNWNSGPFVLKHWRRISRAKAAALNPLLLKNPGGYFYACDAYDKERRLCTAHDTRPAICSGFPWYNEPPYSQDAGWTPEAETLRPWTECSFWLDVPQDQWAEGVRPIGWIPLDEVT